MNGITCAARQPARATVPRTAPTRVSPRTTRVQPAEHRDRELRGRAGDLPVDGADVGDACRRRAACPGIEADHRGSASTPRTHPPAGQPARNPRGHVRGTAGALLGELRVGAGSSRTRKTQRPASGLRLMRFALNGLKMRSDRREPPTSGSPRAPPAWPGLDRSPAPR